MVDMHFTFHIWRQARGEQQGRMVRYDIDGIHSDMSFLETLDAINERLSHERQEPIAFDYDCREGICGSCGMMINGIAHGPLPATATCQLHMRSFRDGSVIYVEPFRATAFPVIKDLVVDRSALDRIVQAGGYISVSTGSAPEANTIPIAQQTAERALDAAACIGCGACVAACPNAAAQLFTGAKVSHLARLPQGEIEAKRRVAGMIDQMEDEGFGSCTNYAECEAVCPAEIGIDVIAQMNSQFLKSKFAATR
jgi:succinate dehydrogenase / fumarate reductase iron-sulfur subunit